MTTRCETTEWAPKADPKAFMAVIFGTALVFTLPRLKGLKRPGRACLFLAMACVAVFLINAGGA